MRILRPRLPTLVTRRQVLGASVTLPFGLTSLAGGGCTPRPPETPLAHLYGKEWVHGAYAYYAKSYLDLESHTNERSFDVYKVLAQKGITALEQLQAREVPFLLKLASDGRRYQIEREVPERLTFTSDMSDADREEATRVWKLAREHIQTDYQDIARLDWSMTRLLEGITLVRNAIDEGALEQFRLCRKIGELSQGGQPPFRLPYQVTPPDYQRVLYLLLDRLDGDSARLHNLESSILAVGLTSRATDSRSMSLAVNVQKVLLAVIEDADAAEKPPAAKYPETDDERDRRLTHGKELYAKVTASPEYVTWLKAEKEREDEIGKFLAVIDQITGLPTSAIYQQAMAIWNGDADYFGYLKLAASFIPGGGTLRHVLDEAVELTERARDVYGKAQRVVQVVDAARRGDGGAVLAAVDGAGLVNTATRRAQAYIGKQLVFVKSKEEIDGIRERLSATRIFTDPLPQLPTPPAG